jgi:glycosyltransferase involved in cell wall biosynthesis
MKFSFVICTYNSARLISEVIHSIINQTERADISEIIIVDYNSSDLTLKIINNILANSSVNFIEIQCSVPGKSPALALGLNAAQGNYVVIVDDDNILYPNYIEEAKNILQNDNIGCLGAQGVVDNNLILPYWFRDYESVYAIGLPAAGKQSDWVWGAGSIINKKAWEDLKKNEFIFLLNPERKSHSHPISIGGEDVELSLAIKLAGYKTTSTKNLKFIHKFQQSRLTEEYLIKNSLGVSRSVTVHELYRTLIEHPDSLIPWVWWLYKISRKLFGCILRVTVSFIQGKKLERQVMYATLIGILSGFYQLKSCYSFGYGRLKKLGNE